MATGGYDSVRVWDVETGESLTPLLRHNGEVWHAGFDPDGRRVLTASSDGTVRLWDLTAASAENSPLGGRRELHRTRHSFRFAAGSTQELDVRIWDLSASDRPLADLRTYGQFLAGLELDDVGRPLPLDSTRIERLWQALQVKYPQDFSPSAPEIRAWHMQEAQNCEISGKWADAERHLSRSLREQPERWDLLARRGRAHAEQGHWHQAVSDYGHARKLAAEQALTWLEREARDCETTSNWPLATRYLGLLVEARPADPAIRLRRAYALSCLLAAP
jgi:hypothetical protein